MLVHGSQVLPPLSVAINTKVAETNHNHSLKISPVSVIHIKTHTKLWFSEIIDRCRTRKGKLGLATIGILAATLVISTTCPYSSAFAAEEEGETLSNVPQMLSGECVLPNDCKKPRIQKPKSRKAERCTSKCVGTCIRGGDGSPGEGPFNIRK